VQANRAEWHSSKNPIDSARMIFLVAVTTLFVFAAANGLALATLLGSSWKTTIALVERRRRLCQVAAYSVPAVAIGKYLILRGLPPRFSSSLGDVLVSLVVGGFLPLLAYSKTSRVLEGFEIRDLISKRD
jgi:hypothetical protein